MKNVIARLRELAPTKPADFEAELDLARRQARLLIAMSGIEEPPVPERIVVDLPRIIVHEVASLSNASEISFKKNDRNWLVLIDGSQPLPWRRRLIMHDFKHIIDHPEAETGRNPIAPIHGISRTERIAATFAACVLMPRSLVEQEWNDGVVELGVLARTFEVSLDDMQRRLLDLGLVSHRGLHPREISV